jgi:ABC-type transport system substrate-binding protein
MSSKPLQHDSPRRLSDTLPLAGRSVVAFRCAGVAEDGQAVPRMSAGLARLVQGWLACTLLLWGCAQSNAQEERRIDREPFDRIVLNQDNEGRVLEVFPLELPQRRLPDEAARTGAIRCRLLTNPEEELEVSWAGIERVELFEAEILREAQKLIAARRFDEAFDHLTYLRDRYPKLEGLEVATDSLLYSEAASLYQARQYERAWLLLDEIHRRSPERKGLSAAMARVLQVLFDQELQEKRPSDALRRYRMAETRYADLVPELLSGWRQRLETTAAEHKQQVAGYLEQGRLREAYLASREMLSVWPDLEGARVLAADVAARYPLLRVGVGELGPAASGSSRRALVDWSVRRSQRLLERQLSELTGVGSDGGVYESPLGKWLPAEDGRSLVLQATAGRAVAPFVAPLWLAMANPADQDYSDGWAELVDRVEPRGLESVAAIFRHPCLRPEALLDQTGLAAVPGMSPYRGSESTGDESGSSRSYLRSEDYALVGDSQPREVVERVYPTPQRALAALRRGEIDLVDRVFPSDVALLQKDAEVSVVAYRVPTLHLLIPNTRQPYLANRLFRRALVYGIDREKILRRDLLGGTTLAGCQTISGPLPVGVQEDDPLAYGYDRRLEPRPYDPRHARTLVQLAQLEVQSAAQKRKLPAPSLSELVLVHPPHEIARVACQEIVADLAVVGILCQLRPLAPGEEPAADEPWDLRYVDVVMPEPISGVQRLLATGGIAGNRSPYLQLALRQLGEVGSWNDVGARLQSVHQLAFDDTAVVPLWQLTDFLAHRRGLIGIAAQPMTTYQAIEAWKLQEAP